MANIPYHLTKLAKERNTTVIAMIEAVLARTDTIEEAATALGIAHPTLLYHMKTNGIAVEVKRCRKIVKTKNAS